MANPYSPPHASSNIEEPDDSALATFQCLRFALPLALLFSSIGITVHRWSGIPALSAILENQIWVVLVFAATSIISILALGTRRLIPNIAQLSLSISGGLILAYYAVAMLNCWISGTQFEWFAFYQRALGKHYWIYWAFIVVLGLCPLLFVFSGVRNSRWTSTPILLIVLTAAMFYLRANFVLNYAHALPTSWHRFFWPF